MKYTVKEEVKILDEVRAVGAIIDIDEETAVLFVEKGQIVPVNATELTAEEKEKAAADAKAKEEADKVAAEAKAKADADAAAAAAAAGKKEDTGEAWSPELHERQKGDGKGWVGNHTVGDLETSPLKPEATS